MTAFLFLLIGEAVGVLALSIGMNEGSRQHTEGRQIQDERNDEAFLVSCK